MADASKSAPWWRGAVLYQIYVRSFAEDLRALQADAEFVPVLLREFVGRPDETAELERSYLTILDLPIDPTALAGAAHALRSFDTTAASDIHAALLKLEAAGTRTSLLARERRPCQRKLLGDRLVHAIVEVAGVLLEELLAELGDAGAMDAGASELAGTV